MKNQKEATCPVCNKAFIGANSAIYCSAKCRKTAAKQRKQKEIAERRLTCAYCGAVFQSAKKRKYCCRSCQRRNNVCMKTKYHRKPCPNCGSKKTRRAHILSNTLPFWWYIECPNCHWCGKTKLFLWRAVRSWNKEKR